MGFLSVAFIREFALEPTDQLPGAPSGLSDLEVLDVRYSGSDGDQQRIRRKPQDRGKSEEPRGTGRLLLWTGDHLCHATEHGASLPRRDCTTIVSSGVIVPLFSLDHWLEVRSLQRRVRCDHLP